MDVIISGGGLDSTALLVLRASIDTNFLVAFVDYGQLARKEELKAIRETMKILGISKSKLILTKNRDIILANNNNLLFGTGINPIVRGRNLQILNSVATRLICIKGASKPFNLIMGLCNEPGRFPDARPAFIKNVNQIMRISYGNVERSKTPLISVFAPYIDTPKLDFLLYAYKAACTHVPSNEAKDLIWNKSFTCWTPKQGLACEQCKHCIKRQILLQKFLQAAKELNHEVS